MVYPVLNVIQVYVGTAGRSLLILTLIYYIHNKNPQTFWTGIFVIVSKLSRGTKNKSPNKVYTRPGWQHPKVLNHKKNHGMDKRTKCVVEQMFGCHNKKKKRERNS